MDNVARFVRGLRRRVFLQDRLATGVLVLGLLLWYVGQLWALEAGWSRASLQWWFTTTDYPTLSPGLVLASLSHSFVSPRHLLANVAVLWLVGGDSEQWMGRWEVLAFFALTGVVAVVLSTVLTNQGTMGASGAAYAFVGFYCVHTVVARCDTFSLSRVPPFAVTVAWVRAFWNVMLTIAPVVFAAKFFGQWTGIVAAGRSDSVGHLLGLVCGVLYAVGRQYLSTL
ncbi:rhomboid family intramembrane serine protease [Halomicroarcula sp. S1AR25-4]|uniref:rhomboid family intramembrane serine protease n=1 Tax=Haloarcula sp. S1AR25-4 TaxID=2950538 RepID=UPI0028765D9E|nr:rhomboid family intramembrane serine protease [Halomicroarcula sp. S1AR25-4]MDS0280354.1 rhomboid family intramembrane serine protease [Halomicroarcula sp. S1AR25-4]